MKKVFFAAFAILLAILVMRIWIENDKDHFKEELSYEEYLKSDRDRYTSFKENVISEIRNRFYLEGSSRIDNQYDHQLKMVSNQFEGPQVHLEEFVYHKTTFIRDTVNKYIRTNSKEAKGFNKFDIHSISYDPDHPKLYKPDIRVTVVPPKPYQERRSANLQKFFEYLDGNSNDVKPYKTYTKEVFTINEDTTITIENINMDLWLTTFSVTIESDSYAKKIKLDPDEEVEFERLGDKEYQNQRHKPFTIVLKIFPNVSPWYINNGSSFDKKADMAIGAIYCSKIKKWPKQATDIGVIPYEAGVALPLIQQDYYMDAARGKLLEVSNDGKTIWNKPIFAEITFTDFGSYNKKWGLNKGDEKITFDFIMPLFVRGSWDIQIPTAIIPEYEPTPPFTRKLSDILLPKWGLKGIGRFFSTIIYIALVFILIVAFFPMVPTIIGKFFRNTISALAGKKD